MQLIASARTRPVLADCRPIAQVAAEVIAFWRDVFSVLLPPAEESDEVSSEQEG